MLHDVTSFTSSLTLTVSSKAFHQGVPNQTSFPFIYSSSIDHPFVCLQRSSFLILKGYSKSSEFIAGMHLQIRHLGLLLLPFLSSFPHPPVPLLSDPTLYKHTNCPESHRPIFHLLLQTGIQTGITFVFLLVDLHTHLFRFFDRFRLTSVSKENYVLHIIQIIRSTFPNPTAALFSTPLTP